MGRELAVTAGEDPDGIDHPLVEWWLGWVKAGRPMNYDAIRDRDYQAIMTLDNSFIANRPAPNPGQGGPGPEPFQEWQ